MCDEDYIESAITMLANDEYREYLRNMLNLYHSLHSFGGLTLTKVMEKSLRAERRRLERNFVEVVEEEVHTKKLKVLRHKDEL